MALHSHAPAWLFSFVDLAFLLLMALTAFAPKDMGRGELGELVVPRLEEGKIEPARVSATAYQLRIHPKEDGASPFELVAPDGAATRLDVAALRARLQALKSFDEGKPLVAPHADSRSEDLLSALGMVDEIWTRERGALVDRIASRE
jgi:hypothetical protein